MSVDNENKNTQEEKNDKTKFIARSQKIGPEKNVEKSKIEPVSVKEINKEDNINDKSHTKKTRIKHSSPLNKNRGKHRCDGRKQFAQLSNSRERPFS